VNENGAVLFEFKLRCCIWYKRNLHKW